MQIFFVKFVPLGAHAVTHDMHPPPSTCLLALHGAVYCISDCCHAVADDVWCCGKHVYTHAKTVILDLYASLLTQLLFALQFRLRILLAISPKKKGGCAIKMTYYGTYMF